MTSYANRGKSLERAVCRLFESYDSRGIHCQQNHPERLHDGTLVRRHGFDFQALYRGKFYAFDAKECATSRWSLGNVKPHQLHALLTVKKQGGEGFFLVHFTGLKELVKMDAETVQKCIVEGNASIPPNVGERTSLDILGIGREA